ESYKHQNYCLTYLLVDEPQVFYNHAYHNDTSLPVERVICRFDFRPFTGFISFKRVTVFAGYSDKACPGGVEWCGSTRSKNCGDCPSIIAPSHFLAQDTQICLRYCVSVFRLCPNSIWSL